MFAKSIIFSNVTDFQIHIVFHENIINISIRILSIYIFIENYKYLKSAAKIMKALLSSEYKSIIRESMKQYYIFSENDNFYIQTSEVNYC